MKLPEDCTLDFEDKSDSAVATVQAVFNRVLSGSTEFHDGDLDLTVIVDVQDGPTISGAGIVHVAALAGALDLLRAIHQYDEEDKKRKEDDASASAASSSSHISRVAADNRCCAEFAARGGHLNVLRFLKTTCGLDMNHQNDASSTPMSVAVQEGHLDIVRFLHRECGVSLASSRRQGGDTLLNDAVRFEHKEVVAYLLASGELNQKVFDARRVVTDGAGTTFGTESTFTVAAMLGNVEIARMLFQAGAHRDALADAVEASRPTKISAVDRDKGTATAAERFYVKMPSFPVLPASMVPAKQQQAPTCKFFEVSGAANRSETNGPLHEAARCGHLEMVKFLIEEAGFGIDKDALLGARTPLLQAARNAKNDVVKYLVTEARCDINKIGKDGHFALYTAAYQGNDELLTFLMSHGANSAMTWIGATPFFVAVSQSRLSTAKVLIESRADVTTSYKGTSPCRYAQEKNLKEMVRLLQEHNIA